MTSLYRLVVRSSRNLFEVRFDIALDPHPSTPEAAVLEKHWSGFSRSPALRRLMTYRVSGQARAIDPDGK